MLFRSEFDVIFPSLNVLVPDNLIFTLSESNVAVGTADIGVDMFEPPTVGSSDNTFMIANQGAGFSQLATDDQNVFFQLSATTAATVPEPASLAMLGGGMAVLLAARKRRRKA